MRSISAMRVRLMPNGATTTKKRIYSHALICYRYFVSIIFNTKRKKKERKKRHCEACKQQKCALPLTCGLINAKIFSINVLTMYTFVARMFFFFFCFVVIIRFNTKYGLIRQARRTKA